VVVLVVVFCRGVVGLVWAGGASHWEALQGLASEGDCLAGDGRTGAQLFCVALAQSFFVAKLLSACFVLLEFAVTLYLRTHCKKKLEKKCDVS
jgi:hypothetical protein